MKEIDVEETLAKLTTVEKISLLSGIDFWHTQAIHEHDIPSLRTSDGPNGVRGTHFFNGVPAACFPCGTGLGATFNQELLGEAGKLMGEEAIAKGAHVLLGPCINMQRSPLGGRGFESIGEDPVLAGLGAAALIKGIQGTGVVSTLKHFVTNDQEHERMAVSSEVTERALREIYLLPFQIAVRDAHPDSFMTAYNGVNGTHVSENKKLMGDVLRGEWGWEGVTMSDWFGTYSTSESVNAGLDLEMPGPSKWRGKLLDHAVSSRKVPRHILDERARNMLKLVNRCVASGVPENAPEGTLDTPETAATLRKLAVEACVLFKNERSVLPFRKDKSVLLIGPNAQTSVFCGGGSSSMRPYHAVSPWDGVKAKMNDPSKMEHAIGCYAHKQLPLVDSQFTITSDPKSKNGVMFHAYNEPPESKHRQAVDEIFLTSTTAMLMDYKNPKITSDPWYADIDGYFTPDRSGEYELGFAVYGSGNVFVDGELVIDNTTTQRKGSAFFGLGTIEETKAVRMHKGKTYHVKVQFASASTSKLELSGNAQFGGGGFRIGGAWVLDMDNTIAEAVEKAKNFDQVVICAGLNGEWESEGADRTTMDLPGRMNDLIAAVAAKNPNTVVVNQSGTPVTLPWLSKVPALLQAWYGGNECGDAIADVLFGDANPSGRSSLSWPKRVQDNPAFYNFRSEAGRVLYGEDVYVGYRHYETVDREVNFGFGYGLSYTTFALSDLQITESGGGDDELSSILSVRVKVSNTGKRDGQDVVQVFLSPPESFTSMETQLRRPPREMKGFAKVAVPAGGSEIVQVDIPLKYACAYWEEIQGVWNVAKGVYGLEVTDGTRSGQGRLTGQIEVEQGGVWNGL